MGIFRTPKQRQPYVPPMGGSDTDNDGPSSRPGTMLGGPPLAANDWLSRLAPSPGLDFHPDSGSDSDPGPGAGRDPNIVLASDDPDDTQVAQCRSAASGAARFSRVAGDCNGAVVVGVLHKIQQLLKQLLLTEQAQCRL